MKRFTPEDFGCVCKSPNLKGPNGGHLAHCKFESIANKANTILEQWEKDEFENYGHDSLVPKNTEFEDHMSDCAGLTCGEAGDLQYAHEQAMKRISELESENRSLKQLKNELLEVAGTFIALAKAIDSVSSKGLADVEILIKRAEKL